MRVISRKALNDFAEKHSYSRSALADWYSKMKASSFHSLVEVRSVFPTADVVGKLTVFNIGGNTVRLVTAIHYNRGRVYIRAVLTHAEYDTGAWKE
ncbi:MAG: type II toxin-antitoxin system HigB family toxin [Ktedonobacterales bacterium]